MVDFNCNGLLELRGSRVERELQNETLLSTGGSNRVYFAYEV